MNRQMDQKYIKLLSDWNVSCKDAIAWFSEQETVEQAWYNCNRGDWLLWLVARLEINERKLFLAKGRTAELVIHLMKDKRSVRAVEATIAYGNGEIDRDVATAAYADAYPYADTAAADTTAYVAADTAAYAAADTAAYVVAAAAAYAAAAYAAAAAKKDILLKSANIVREVYTLQEVLDAIN